MEQNTVTVTAPAKVNLALHIGSARDDGYHELASVFQAVSIADEVSATRATDIRLTMSGRETAHIPIDQRNLATRAAMLLRDRHGEPDLGADIHIHKEIPAAGGMAGGSADAAATLVACNRLWKLGCTYDQLHAIACELGSDVPFSLLGGTALGRGRGEQLTPISTELSFSWVFAIINRGLSTPTVFAEFDRMVADGRLNPSAEPPEALIQSLEAGDPNALAYIYNGLQAPAISLVPSLQTVLDAGRYAGAHAAFVSGSGPTCAFVCQENAIDNVVQALEDQPTVVAALPACGPVAGPGESYEII